jgi:hypothetical protein
MEEKPRPFGCAQDKQAAGRHKNSQPYLVSIVANELWAVKRLLRSWSGIGYWFSANATNPSFAAFLDCLNIRETGVGEEFAMLINAQERHARPRGVFLGEP